MKTSLYILLFFGATFLLLSIMVGEYIDAKSGINHYSCEMYHQPVNCIDE